MKNDNTKLNEVLQNLENNIESILNKENLKINDDFQDIKKLQEQITLKYNNTKPENVVKSTIIDEYFVQDNIKYLIKYLKIDNTKSKPILINKKRIHRSICSPHKA